MGRSQFGDPVTAGIEQEIRELYADEAAGMLRHAVSVAGNSETAQDAVQEAFLRFFIARTAGQRIQTQGPGCSACCATTYWIRKSPPPGTRAALKR